MCKPHWNQYTNALRKAALARKAAEAAPAQPEPAPAPRATPGSTTPSPASAPGRQPGALCRAGAPRGIRALMNKAVGSRCRTSSW